MSTTEKIDPYILTFHSDNEYYFGSPKSFGEGFHAISLRMPTQITVLNALRAALLRKKGMLKADGYPDFENKKNEIYNLTGKAEIKSLEDTNTDFGIIKQLSPLFLIRQEKGHNVPDDCLIQVPNDVTVKKNIVPSDSEKKESYFNFEKIVYKKIEKSKSSLSENESLVISSVKDNPADYFGGTDFWNAYINNKSIPFHNHYRGDFIFNGRFKPGIAREGKITKDKAFYRRESFKISDTFAFAVIVHCSVKPDIDNDWIFLGGERSLFKVKVNQIDNSSGSIFNIHPVVKTFLDYKNEPENKKEELKGKYAAVSPIINNEFRNSSDYFAAYNFEILRFIPFEEKHSDTYNIIPPGALFWFNETKKLNTVNTLIQNKLGFNRIIKISEDTQL